MPELLPILLNLAGRPVLLVGGGRVAAAKLEALMGAGASVRVVAPHVLPSMVRAGVEVVERAFVPADLDDAWLVVAAATPDANREVAAAADLRRVFVNAVDDPGNATAFLGGVVRRAGVTLAISTSGDAPALTSLLRQALDAELPEDLAAWVALSRVERLRWRQERVPMDDRRPQLLRALNDLYARSADEPAHSGGSGAASRLSGPAAPGAAVLAVAAPVIAAEQACIPALPWLNGPEDSWL